MTWTADYSGTLAAASVTIGTETTLATDTTNGTFVFDVDMSAMAIGDITELRIYKNVLSGGTLYVCWKSTFAGGLILAPVVSSPSQPSLFSLKVTLKQVAGTARAYPWSLNRI